jgi:CheY-like chemotaxis protein
MILYGCQDLIFSTKIRSTAESLGIATRAVSAPGQLATIESDTGAAIGAIMIDLDLGDTALALIDAAKANLPDTTIIAFGAHVAKDVLDSAKAHGAHQVLPRSAFTQKLPELLEAHSSGTP